MWTINPIDVSMEEMLTTDLWSHWRTVICLQMFLTARLISDCLQAVNQVIGKLQGVDYVDC